MKIQVLGCFGGDLKSRFPAFLIDEKVLLDAGTIGGALSLENQLKIQSILISHHHIDHLIGLPFFVETIYNKNHSPIRLFGLSEVLRCLRTHLLNDVLWPDFTRLPNSEHPTVACCPVEDGKYYEAAPGIRFIPIMTCHTGPACGYLIAKKHSALVYTGDTGPCDTFWESLARITEENPNIQIKGLLIECSFPNHLESFAIKTGHLTPALLENELAKFNHKNVQIMVFHMKPQYIGEIEMEIRKISDYSIELMKPDQEYFFD
ncbi:3',5'-cyclic-nucleotide phosphodiesterase [bacterium]|nr:3',5'-cyclic-nucleotide phosphodiesterase [candidate division CSSED10-310 bacterium]